MNLAWAGNCILRWGICYSGTMHELRQKVVLVTGGSGGLGRALAHAFARQGSAVVIAGRSEEKLKRAAMEVSQEGGRIMSLPCDVTRRHQVKALGEAIRAEWGMVQILVNNAGVARAVGFLEMEDSLWDETLQTNLTGTYNCCKVFLPGMIETGWGRIINIASTSAKVAYSHASAYTSSKHGVLGLTRALAVETARLGVTVNAICPGYLDDELTHDNARAMAVKTGKKLEDILRLFAQSAPQKRLIAPAEVAALALMIAAEKAGGITGQAINVDGGAVMA